MVGFLTVSARPSVVTRYIGRLPILTATGFHTKPLNAMQMTIEPWMPMVNSSRGASNS